MVLEINEIKDAEKYQGSKFSITVNLPDDRDKTSSKDYQIGRISITQ